MGFVKSVPDGERDGVALGDKNMGTWNLRRQGGLLINPEIASSRVPGDVGRHVFDRISDREIE
jgi:hypothetical protein